MRAPTTMPTAAPGTMCSTPHSKEARQRVGDAPADNATAGIAAAPAQPARQSAEEPADQGEREAPGQRPQYKRETVVHRPVEYTNRDGAARASRSLARSFVAVRL